MSARHPLDWHRRRRPTVERFDDGGEPYHLAAQCYVYELRYDFRRRIGHLLMPDDACTDMAGAIDTFRRIDPGVLAVVTYAGRHPDMIYVFTEGDWQARDPQPEGATHV